MRATCSHRLGMSVTFRSVESSWTPGTPRNGSCLSLSGWGKCDDCPLKTNRLVTGADQVGSYRRVDALSWTQDDECSGKHVHLRDFPKGHRVSVFRLLRSTPHSEPEVTVVVTNDRTHPTVQVVQTTTDLRWKVEEFHRETKHVTGIEACQCRIGRIQRKHIACAILVWNRLKELAIESQTQMVR